jgi:hypothetical protein
LSSTTERQRGQVLAIFALSLVAVLGAGALAFDGGLMVLERRDQQNAADAAAMAGARYVTTNHTTARSVAANVASANGFTHGSGSQVVNIEVPPTTGQFATWPNAIQVRIENTRPSIFGAVLGFLNWPVSAQATAASLDGVGGPFSILALEPSVCEAMKVAGTGGIVANGNIQVNSSCPTAALKRQAGGTITVTASSSACNVHGGIQDGGGNGLLNCLAVEGAPVVPDPLDALPDVPAPLLPQPAVQLVGNKKIPDGCPGSASPATLGSPAMCQFQSSYKDTVWRLFPGAYPGGLKIQAGSFYLEPGIYWLGGGGLDITGNGSLIQSVDTGMTNEGGGVLFYNTSLPGAAAGPISLNGASANIHLQPLDVPGSDWQSTWNGMIIYQDRDVAIGGDDLTVNGNDSVGMDVRGTIYLPDGDVKINGNNGDLVMDQIIAKTYVVNGNSGDILALRDQDKIFKFSAAGLVE